MISNMIFDKQNELHNDTKETIKNSNSDFNGYFSSELLAPAGSIEAFYAAINAGADAVYMGGSMFGARAFANNPDEDALLELIDYAHLHDKKLYLTVNTLLKNNEINNLYEYILPYYKRGLDAVIVQDFGVLDFFYRYFPDLPVHISTQMTITNTYMGNILKQYPNVHRIVTARELSLEEIQNIHLQTGLEIESFVHGALCYSYSGQCLFSSIVGGRSGNRGRCAQPCRLAYKSLKDGDYPLSPKDLMTLKLLPQILKSGVYSLKIEGRMKKPEYVASVVSIYRYYLDLLNKVGPDKYEVSEKDIDILLDIYNRGNFTDGYYTKHNGSNMISQNRPNHTGLLVLKQKKDNIYTTKKKLNIDDLVEINDKAFSVTRSVKENIDVNIYDILQLKKNEVKHLPKQIYRTRNSKLIGDLTENYLVNNKKILVTGYVSAKLNENLSFSLKYNDITIEVSKDVVTEALNKPVTKEILEEKFSKIGNLPFKYSNLFIDIDDNIFVNMKDCNELRRQAFLTLTERILEKYRRVEPENNWKESSLDKKQILTYNDNRVKKCNVFSKFNILVSKTEQLYMAINFRDYIDIVYIDLNFYPISKLESDITYCKDKGVSVYLALPYIFRNKAENELDSNGYILEQADGYLVRTLEEYGYLKKCGYKNTENIVFDYNVYNYNSFANSFFNSFIPKLKTLSLELDYYELKDLSVDNGELMIYGQFPLMISAQCVNKTDNNCLMKSDNYDNGLNHFTVLKDRLGNDFNSVPVCRYCYSLIYNNKPLSLLNVKEKAVSLEPEALRLNFVFEGEKQVEELLEDFIKVYIYNKSIENTGFSSNDYTKGHFLRKTD